MFIFNPGEREEKHREVVGRSKVIALITTETVLPSHSCSAVVCGLGQRVYSS